MNLSHTPIVSVDYEHVDEYGDAKHLSIGWATWNQGQLDPQDENIYSAKIFRRVNVGKTKERWSRQSEELPLWRVLDLAILVVTQITGKESDYLKVELAGKSEEIDSLRSFISKHKDKLYNPRLEELRRLLEK